MHALSAALLICTATFAGLSYLPPVDSASTGQSSDAEGAPAGEEDALDVARAYLDGMSAGELDALDGLFVADGRSSVFENGSDEGSWGHYKEHHLAPEQAAAGSLLFTTDEERAERCGDGFLVRLTGGFVVGAGGEARSFRAVVSFVLVPTEEGLRILHLHWSSRRAR